MQLRRAIVPTAGQALASLLISLALLALIFHSRVTELITGASGITPRELQASYHQALSTINDVGFVPKLTIAIFWAGVGVVAYFLALTLSNFVIAVRNEVVVDTTFANRGTIIERFRLPLVRLALTVAFGLFLLISIKVLLVLWIALASQLLLDGVSVGHIAAMIAGVVGLAINWYLAWMLALAIKDLESLL